jgi:hypothetical protein
MEILIHYSDFIVYVSCDSRDCCKKEIRDKGYLAGLVPLTHAGTMGRTTRIEIYILLIRRIGEAPKYVLIPQECRG